ncbi:MAG: DUF3021 family protein [Lachnospiraceae bacterium]|nr:DUF3021 family protein [Lachnospiraceae bacterium]
MKEKIMKRLPFIFAFYTIIILVCCIYNLLLGNTLIEIQWFLELFAFLVLYALLERVLAVINFKSDLSYTIAEFVMGYVLFLLFGYMFHWISFTPGNLLAATVLFLICSVSGVMYLNYRYKLRTKELNELLKKNQ